MRTVAGDSRCSVTGRSHRRIDDNRSRGRTVDSGDLRRVPWRRGARWDGLGGRCRSPRGTGGLLMDRRYD
jgi:hypothetical protein